MNSKPEYLSSSQIVNVGLYESIRELVACHICHGILIDPTTCCECESTYCKPCIQAWKLNQRTNIICPMKCPDNNFHEPTRVLKNLLDKLEFKCSYCNSEIIYSYQGITKHYNIECEKRMIECELCKNLVKYTDYRSTEFYQEFTKKGEEIKYLNEENRRLRQENIELNKKLKKVNQDFLINKQSSESNCSNRILSISNNQLELFDKCPHFKGNYIPIFKCCEKSFPCYICHQEATNHLMELSDKVICLYCKEIYSGNCCESCGAFQLYKKKVFID